MQCYDEEGCGGDSVLMDSRECCVESDTGRSFSMDEQCHQCAGKQLLVALKLYIDIINSLVFGWFVDDFIQVERSLAYSVSAGWQKRPSDIRQSLSFEVIPLDQGSAGNRFFKRNTIIIIQ